MPSAKNSAASVGMMTLPIQFVRFVMPVRKFIMPRESHHRNDKLPDSGYGEKGTGAGDKTNRWTPEGEVDDRADYRQARCNRHDAAGRISPGALEDGGRAETCAVVPALEKRCRRWYCEQEHRAEDRGQGSVSLAEVDHRTQ